MKLGFIGCGNMAAAMLKGVEKSKLVPGGDIVLYDRLDEKAHAQAADLSAAVAESAGEVVRCCDVVVLAVKPNVLETLLGELDGALKARNPLIISIAAGKTLAFLEGCLTYKPALVRVMPNINAAVLEAVSAYCPNENVSAGQLAFTRKLCESFGKAVELDEAFFSVFGVIGGCSPAFAFMFIDAMARAAVKNGMSKDKALEICAQAVLGSARLILESGESPWNLVDKVCSPAGTTIEGVLSLQRDGFEAAVAAAVQAAADKDKRL